MIDRTSVAEVLAYARSGQRPDYDLIGFRVRSMSSFAGAFPLQTLAGLSAEAERHGGEKAEHLKQLRQEVNHLSFGFKVSDAKIAFEVTARDLCLKWRRDGYEVQRWMSLAEPPALLLQHAKARDAAAVLARGLSLRDADFWWLPFSELLEQGRFVRMQECVDRLSDTLDPENYYAFISHRWADPNQPDPSGRQAALVAWQVLGHLVNAVWVGAARGRHTPRKISEIGYAFVDVNGSELAESILVNVLRSLPEELFAALVVEAEQFDDIEDDFGARLALADIGLKGLRTRLERTPHIREILGRFRLWYDYSCMPQHQRTLEEQERFELLLKRLGMIQALCRTVVLLESIEDYLSRAWCAFESTISSEYLNNTLDVLHGGEVLVDSTSQHASFRRVLVDRPYLIWRGILDTEVFGIQSPEECMSRLRLDTTRPEDLGIVYEFLRDLGPPPSIHFDGAEVITGFFPLPIQAGSVVVASGSRRFENRESPIVSTIDTANSTTLVPVGSQGLPAFEAFDNAGPSDAPSAHVTICERCEGEAILYARWVRESRHAIGAALGVVVHSLSWVASDVAPVGHFAVGDLTIRGVQSDVWVVMGSHSSLTEGPTSKILTETLWAAGIEYFEMEINADSIGVVRRYVPGHSASDEQQKRLRRLDPEDQSLTTYAGGLFRNQFVERLGA